MTDASERRRLRADDTATADPSLRERTVGDAAWRAQVVRFCVIGLLGFVTDAGGFLLLVHGSDHGYLHEHPLIAKVLTGAAATVVSWVGNRYWAFRDTRRPHALHEFLIFAVIANLGSLIAVACLWLSRTLGFDSALADTLSANGIGLALAMAFRFWAYRTHVFSASPDGSGLDSIVAHQEHEESVEPSRATEPN